MVQRESLEMRESVEMGVTQTRPLLASWMAERADIDLSQFLLSIVMQRSGRILEASFDRMCRLNFDISGQDMRVLFALRRNGVSNGLRSSHLFRALLVTSGAITKQVDRLQAKGLVARLPNRAERSAFKVFLTVAGVKVADKATEIQASHSLLTAALASFTPEEQKSGASFLHRLLETLETEFAEEQRSRSTQDHETSGGNGAIAATCGSAAGQSVGRTNTRAPDLS